MWKLISISRRRPCTSIGQHLFEWKLLYPICQSHWLTCSDYILRCSTDALNDYCCQRLGRNPCDHECHRHGPFKMKVMFCLDLFCHKFANCSSTDVCFCSNDLLHLRFKEKQGLNVIGRISHQLQVSSLKGSPADVAQRTCKTTVAVHIVV